MRAFIFPGQGSQVVGMGKAIAEAFPVARDVFAEVDEALGQHLSRLMWQGPEGDLMLTENAQPAIMTASMAIIRMLQKDAGLDLARHARVVAGHSLGEYSALCAAGAFTLSETARSGSFARPGHAGRRPGRRGGMSALIGIDIEAAEAAVKEASEVGVVVVANDNAPGQIVISGEQAAVDKAGEIAKTKGAKARDPACRQHAQSFAAAEIRRRADARCARGRHHPPACRAGGGQCHRDRNRRPGYDPPPARRAGDVARPLARERRFVPHRSA